MSRRPTSPLCRTIAGKLDTLQVHTMSNVGGVAVYPAMGQLHTNDCLLLRRTLHELEGSVFYISATGRCMFYADFVRHSFFASPWHNTPASMPRPSRDVFYDKYLSQLKQLSEGLLISFRPTVDYLISRLPELFKEDWPLVPHHTNLLENNIHVDPETGRICGICDCDGSHSRPARDGHLVP